ncbi:MAG: hypothetical protein KBD05_00300 [Candidatus Pacebacteria bacterium]|nr:hypothetical protein [Candidatus Paceibacterota bacterium]
MDDFLKMDVFFAVTTVAVLTFTVLVSLVLMRMLSILKSLERIVLLAEKETELVREDLVHLREKVSKEGLKLRHIVGFFGGLGKKRKSKS